MTEHEIQNAILRYLSTRDDLRAWRQNTGVAEIDGRRVAFGVPGAADISGVLAGGRRLEIECKSAVGRQSNRQKAYEKMINRFGGLYVLARSVDDVRGALPAEADPTP